MTIDLMNTSINTVLVEPAKKFVWSPLQTAIFDVVQHEPTESIIVEAVAGGAKTTTIIEATRYISKDETPLFLAFNKAIVNELESRLPGNINAKTFHSLGMSILRKTTKLKVNFNKTMELIDEIYGDTAFRKEYGNKLALKALIGYAKGNGHTFEAGGPQIEDWEILIDYHDVDFVGNINNYLSKLTLVYNEGLGWTDVIDFDDMLLHPVVNNHIFPQYSTIIVDESQDLNSLQHLFLNKLCSGRVIAVGDTYQAIYGFRGADASSMGNLRKMFCMKQMDLNYSYRCPKAIARLAQDFVPHFLPLDDAPEGDIITTFELPEPGKLKNDTLVLCRYNAPLFKYGMEFLSKRKPVQLRTSLGFILKSRIKKFKAQNTTPWRQQLGAWVELERIKFLEKEQYSRIQTLEDTHRTLLALSEGTTSVLQILKNLDYLITSKSGPILSTIHRAKGLEADTVLIIDYGSMPSQWAKLDWMLKQEKNLTYVAITRAKKELILHYKEEK